MTTDVNRRPPNVLLVEDNPDDVELTRLGFQRAKLHVNLMHVENGEECMHALRKEGAYADAPTPDIILLDLNLPVMDGREVLAEIVRDEALCTLPVIVLTTSSAANDVLYMYRLRCSAYITKPVDFSEFQKVVQQIEAFWLSLVVLPSSKVDAA